MLPPEDRLPLILAAYLSDADTLAAYDIEAVATLPRKVIRIDVDAPDINQLSFVGKRTAHAHPSLCEVQVMITLVRSGTVSHNDCSALMVEVRRALNDIELINEFMGTVTESERQGWQILYTVVQPAITVAVNDDSKQQHHTATLDFQVEVSPGV
jgi:hypothetical protein